MEDSKKEKEIVTSPEPVSFEGTKNILDQMNNCVCRIYNNGEGTGFFTKIPYKSKLLPVLSKWFTGSINVKAIFTFQAIINVV